MNRHIHSLHQNDVDAAFIFCFPYRALVFQLNPGSDTDFTNSRNSRVDMIGLHSTPRQQYICAFGLGITDIEFQWPSFVAAKCEARVVIAF